MQALVYDGPGQKALQDRPRPILATILDACETFAKAAEAQASRVIIEA